MPVTAAAGAGITVSPAPYLPFTDRHKGRPPGLFALDPATWTEADAAFAPQMALRDRLLASGDPRLVGARPGSGAALEELANALAAHLVATGRGYARAGAALVRPDGARVPLAPDPAAIGRLAQEDWLLLAPPAREGGEYTLEAGALAFPAGWALDDRIGRPLTAVHAPVPGYAEGLAARVNRVFAALHPDRPLQRLNYSIAGNARLSCPDARGQHARDPGTGPHLRVERQTLRRLPASGWVAFGIKTCLTPLSALSAAERAALADAYAAMSPAHARYRHAEDFPRAEILG